MSEIYSFRVLAVEGNRLTLRVALEDAGHPLVPDQAQAFRFVWEPWAYLCRGNTFRPPEEGSGEVIPPQEARERGRRAPLTAALAGQDVQNLDWFFANAARFVFCVGVTDHVNYTNPDDEDSGYNPEIQPQATYSITATDPAWLEHLTPGMWWPSSGFADGIPYLPNMFGWLTPAVVALVRGIDADPALDRLPVLADALEQAGCDDTAFLDHCRGPGEHVRGCWVVHWLQEAIRAMG